MDAGSTYGGNSDNLVDFDTRSFQGRDLSSTERKFGLVFLSVDELSGNDFGDMKRDLFEGSLEEQVRTTIFKGKKNVQLTTRRMIRVRGLP